jgi:DNA helicase-2/ATP-dependent DNA helicase PcrA
VSISLALEGLNPEQLTAVTHQQGSMLVLAGAGSGKTQVLTTRIVWLIKEKNINPSQVLAVTFTNKAAKEMLQRVATQLNIDTKFMWIGTFHSIALRFLTKHYKEAGLPSFFHILDSQDQLNLLKRIIKKANIDETSCSIKELQKFINYQKEQGYRACDLQANNLRHEMSINIYREYEMICNNDGLVDFTELLLRSYELFSTNQTILDLYTRQFKHILIDEFQDTNQLQYKWLQLIGSKCDNVFAVGDDDQSIYSFRGAKALNMQAFLQDFKVSQPIRLEQNYRSTSNILQAANAVIDNNSNRIGKKLWTTKNDGNKIKLYEGYTEEDEAYFVVDEIKSLHNAGLNLSSIAILYRSNAQSRILEHFFYTQGLAYRVYGGLRFFDRQEIKHVLAYLRLIKNTNDNEAFLRIVNVPARKIGAKTIEGLQNIATSQNISLFAACNILEGKAQNSLLQFTNLINTLQQQSLNQNLTHIVSLIIELSGLRQMYVEDKKNSAERLDNLNELVNAVTNFKVEEGQDIVATFLAHAVLESGDGQAQKYEDSVQLMTVHAAKGLEFDTVFVVGLEDGLFPHENCLDQEKDLEEERRLMYVAITRAKSDLYIVRACSRLIWGKRISAPISRFVNEIPGELINNMSGISKIGKSNLEDFNLNEVSSNNWISEDRTNNVETKISRVQLTDQDVILKIGDMVKHVKFGKGKILNLNIDGNKKTAEIFFIGMGKKVLDLTIAKIEKI